MFYFIVLSTNVLMFRYAIGGHDGTNHLSSAECYDPAEKKWITVRDERLSSNNFDLGLTQYLDKKCCSWLTCAPAGEE